MRKTILSFLLLLSMLMCLTACGGNDSVMKPYTVMTSDKTVSAASMMPAEAFAGFAKDLGVISVSDSESGYNSAAMNGVDAKEIFLAAATDGEILAGSNIYETMPPASITKILTALLTLESGLDLDEKYTLTSDIEVTDPDAQLCGFEVGDVVSLRTLLYCTLIYSGNDAANAVASAVSGGDIPAFCEKMNERAAQLGATQTHFLTPNGLDTPDHYTSAYDLYLIFRECIKYDIFMDAVSQSSYTASFERNGEEISFTFPSTNHYLTGEDDPALPKGVTIVGGKTGMTDNAGTCLILYVEDNEGNGYISLLLGSPDKATLYDSMTKLLSNLNN